MKSIYFTFLSFHWILASHCAFQLFMTLPMNTISNWLINEAISFSIVFQIKNFWDIVPAEVGDRFLSMLPPWHAYERACEYFIFTRGVEQVYTTVRNLKVVFL